MNREQAGGPRNPLEIKEIVEEMNLGEYLQAIRIQQDLSVRDLSRVSGVDHSIISRIENNINTDPKISTLIQLAYGLRIGQYQRFLLYESAARTNGIDREEFFADDPPEANNTPYKK